MSGSGIPFELWVDVLCPFSLLAVRRAREAIAEFEGEVRLRLRALPLVDDPERHDRTAGSREEARAAFAGRLEDAVGLNGGESFFVGAQALREGTLLLPSSLPALAAVKWAETAAGDLGAFRLFRELASQFHEHGANPSDPAVIAAAALELRLPGATLAEALRSGAPAREVRADAREARLLGFTCTPVALIDRTRVDGLATADEYRETVALRLRSRRRAAGA